MAENQGFIKKATLLEIVINTMKRENIKIISISICAPKFHSKNPGAQVLVMMPSVGGTKEITNYSQLFDYDIDLLVNAFAKLK